jgi:hypothetical protein
MRAAQKIVLTVGNASTVTPAGTSTVRPVASPTTVRP